MRVIIFCWEFPPRVVGKLSDYVSALSAKLAARRIEVDIVTYDDSPIRTVDSNGVKTSRVSNPVKTHNSVLTWVLTLNQEVERAAASYYYDANKKIDAINAWDWHFIPAAVAMKDGLGIPFVYSVESLEDHRSNFANYPINMAIKSIEWLGFYEASLVTVKTDWMRNEVVRIYKVPKEKIVVIPSVIDSKQADMLKVYELLIGGSTDK